MRKWIAVILTVLLLLPACALAADPLPLKIKEYPGGAPVKPSMYGYELKDGMAYVITGSSDGGLMLDITGDVTVTLENVNLKDSLEISSRAFGEKKVSLNLTGNNYISSHDQPAILVMADKCDLTIQTAPTDPPHSLKLKSVNRAGIQNTNGKVSLDSGYIDIQAGSVIPYAITASSIEYTPYRAYPKVRHWIGEPWRNYDTEMDRILTTRQVATYSVLQNRYAGSEHESNVTPGTRIQLVAGTRTGYKFERWESKQKEQIEAVNEGFDWTVENPFLYTPACDIVLFAVWSKDAEEETKEYGNLTVIVTPTGVGNVVGTIGEGSPFVADGTEAYLLGTSVKLEAQALPQYEFINWSTEGDIVISEDPTYLEEVNGDRTLYANFRKRPYVEEVLVTKRVDGDLDSSITGAKPIEYVYVWGDDYSVWGSKVTSPGYTAVDVISDGGSKTGAITVTVSGEATWYALGEVTDSGKVAGYTCVATPLSADFGSTDDDNAYKIGSLPFGLGDGDGEGAAWIPSAIRTVPDYPEIATLPTVLPEYTFLNTYEEVPVYPVTITKRLKGIKPEDLPEGTVFNFVVIDGNNGDTQESAVITREELIAGNGEASTTIMTKYKGGMRIGEEIASAQLSAYEWVGSVAVSGDVEYQEIDKAFDVKPFVCTGMIKPETGEAVVTYTNEYTPVKVDLPKTGDESDLALWACAMILSSAAGVMLLRKKREA